MAFSHFFKSKSTIKRSCSVGFAAATGLAALVASAPAHALTWNWQFESAIANGSGTYTTDGTTAAAGITYAISSISGTYFDGANTYSDLFLDGYGGASNTFQWDGTNLSPITSDFGGISFSYNGGSSFVNIFYAGAGYGAVQSELSAQSSSIASSSLTPAVPGPIPVFGAAAAFGWSRRLRHRIKKS